RRDDEQPPAPRPSKCPWELSPKLVRILDAGILQTDACQLTNLLDVFEPPPTQALASQYEGFGSSSSGQGENHRGPRFSRPRRHSATANRPAQPVQKGEIDLDEQRASQVPFFID